MYLVAMKIAIKSGVGAQQTTGRLSCGGTIRV